LHLPSGGLFNAQTMRSLLLMFVGVATSMAVGLFLGHEAGYARGVRDSHNRFAEQWSADAVRPATAARPAP
jgi:hypothetical protein